MGESKAGVAEAGVCDAAGGPGYRGRSDKMKSLLILVTVRRTGKLDNQESY